MWGSKIPCTLHKNKSKKMDKKFYEMPEVEVIDLQIEGQLLALSDEEKIDDAAGDTDNTGGSSDDSGLGD